MVWIELGTWEHADLEDYHAVMRLMHPEGVLPSGMQRVMALTPTSGPVLVQLWTSAVRAQEFITARVLPAISDLQLDEATVRLLAVSDEVLRPA